MHIHLFTQIAKERQNEWYILAWVVLHFWLKTISPNSVCHVNRYYKTPWFFSEFSGEYSEAADHLCKYKGFPEKYKGKTSPTFFLQKRGFIMRFYSSTLGTSLLMSRRVDRHPSWNVLKSREIACACNFHQNCMRMQLCMQFSVHTIFSWWVSINSSGHQ